MLLRHYFRIRLAKKVRGSVFGAVVYYDDLTANLADLTDRAGKQPGEQLSAVSRWYDDRNSPRPVLHVRLGGRTARQDGLEHVRRLSANGREHYVQRPAERARMGQAPQKGVCGTARREFPHEEIACSPQAMPDDGRERTRPEHKMAEILVE